MPEKIGRDKFLRVLRRVLDLKEDKVDIISGSLGRYNQSGVKEIAVPGRAGFVWVRVRGQTSEVVQAFNDAVGLFFDLPVLMIREPTAPRYYRVISRDIGLYQAWAASGIAYHGDQHSFADPTFAGRDIVYIFKRQMAQPLLCRPQANQNMTVYVEADYYFAQGDTRYWAGGSSPDFTSLKPTAGFRFVTVYLRISDASIQLLPGDSFSVIPGGSPSISNIPEPDPTVGIQLASVLLDLTTTSIGWGNLYDLRIMLFSGSGGIPAGHQLDPIHGAHTGTLSAERVTIVDSGGYYTGVTVELALQELWASGHIGQTPGHIISDGSVTYAQRRNLEFLGASVSLADVPARDSTVLTIQAPGVLDTQNQNVEVVNDATEQTLWSLSLPGKTLGYRNLLRIYGFGSYLNDSGAPRAFILNFKYGGVTVLTVTISGLAAGAVRRWTDIAIQLRGDGSHAAQYASWEVGAPSFLDSQAQRVGSEATSNVNSDIAQTISLTVQHNLANPSVSYILRHLVLELIRDV